MNLSVSLMPPMYPLDENLYSLALNTAFPSVKILRFSDFKLILSALVFIVTPI